MLSNTAVSACYAMFIYVYTSLHYQRGINAQVQEHLKSVYKLETGITSTTIAYVYRSICTCVCQRFARLLHLLVCDLLLCMVLLLLYSTACAEAVLSTYRLLAVLAEQCAIQPVAGAAAKAHSALHNHDLVRY